MDPDSGRVKQEIGWILRRWDGCPVAAGYKNVERLWKISWLEAFVVCKGQRSMPTNSPKVRIELDALQIVRRLSRKDQDVSDLGKFIEEAQALMASTSRRIESTVHVSRIHNTMLCPTIWLEWLVIIMILCLGLIPIQYPVWLISVEDTSWYFFHR